MEKGMKPGVKRLVQGDAVEKEEEIMERNVGGMLMGKWYEEKEQWSESEENNGWTDESNEHGERRDTRGEGRREGCISGGREGREENANNYLIE